MEDPKIVELRAQLAAASEARAAAEKAASVEREGRLAEREARLAAEMAASAAEKAASAEREARLAAEKATFFMHMNAISSSNAATASSGSDVTRRGAVMPDTCALSEVLHDLPAPPTCVPQWAAFCAEHARSWKEPRAEKLDENRDIHPTMCMLLAAAAPRELRLWSNALAADDVPSAEIRPDFTLAHVRDAALSVVGALVQGRVGLG